MANIPDEPMHPDQFADDCENAGNRASSAQPLLTASEARAEFTRRGISIAEWARERGFSAELTRMVLQNKRKCLRGQSHQIAVALGIKRDVASGADEHVHPAGVP